MAHPAVFEAAVIAVPDERWHERPLCCVVLRPEPTASAEELRDFLADRVAKWWLPERWTFIESVPKTSVGKFDKKVLRAQYAEGELDVEVARASGVPRRPRRRGSSARTPRRGRHLRHGARAAAQR